MIAIALLLRPKLLIADEATTALDVTTQARIMELLLELQAELGMAVIFISHDLSLAASYTDDVIVMYAGRIVERATAAELFSPRPDALHRGPARCDPAARMPGAHSAAGGRRPLRPTRLRCPPAAGSRHAAATTPMTAGGEPPLVEHGPTTAGPAGPRGPGGSGGIGTPWHPGKTRT